MEIDRAALRALAEREWGLVATDERTVRGQSDRRVTQPAEERGPRRPGGGGGAQGDADPGNAWPAEPYVGRVAHGVSQAVGQLRALGNAIVPALGAQVIGAFMEYEARANG